MTRLNSALVLLVLFGVVSAPLATFHPVADHLVPAGMSLSHELRNGAVIALLILFGASILPTVGGVAVALGWLKRVRAMRRLEREATSITSPSGIEYRLLPTDAITFFTAGVLRPRIYASSGALNTMPERAFTAALLHERAHQRGHHVPWRLALAVLETAFRPIAPVRRAVASLAMDCELAADRAAIAAGANRLDLFEAVVAASQSATPYSAAALSGTGTLVRLEALASGGPPARPAQLPLLGVVASLSLLPAAAHALIWLGAVCL